MAILKLGRFWGAVRVFLRNINIILSYLIFENSFAACIILQIQAHQVSFVPALLNTRLADIINS